MTKPTTIQFATAATAHARINQLEALLSLPLSAEQINIGLAWDRIDELEARQNSENKATTPTAKPAATRPAPKTEFTDPLAHVTKDELRGIARAAAAQREGRTAKPTPKASTAPLTGVMRAAKAQQELNRKNKS
jgi:hypothetical protein